MPDYDFYCALGGTLNREDFTRLSWKAWAYLEALTAELRTVNQALNKKTKGRIRCEKLFPFLDVQIGRLSEEVITIEENCDIHVEENKIVLE